MKENNLKSKLAKTAVVGLAALALTGCAETWNKAANRGGLFFSESADYIVVNHSGGEIMDVYKLQDVIVSSPTNSDGWIFQDSYGNSVNLGGDIKHIRIAGQNSDLWNKYCEYHMEFANGKTYQESCPQGQQ